MPQTTQPNSVLVIYTDREEFYSRIYISQVAAVAVDLQMFLPLHHMGHTLEEICRGRQSLDLVLELELNRL